MVRLTSDLLSTSLDYLSPLSERELDLRGHQIRVIENLGAHSSFPSLEAIDFTDNAIATLSGFPQTLRLKTLLLGRNRLRTISPTIAEQIPALETLVLNENGISELADLDPLGDLKRLSFLSVLENPVTDKRKNEYRAYLIFRCPSLRWLDYARVTDKERKAAKEMFGTVDEPTEKAKRIMGAKSKQANTFEPGEGVDGDGEAQGRVRVKLTDEERRKVQELIKNAKSLGEITRLEKALAEGRIPT